MINPYETPKSNLESKRPLDFHVKSILWVAICFISYEVLAWKIVPILNGKFATALEFTGIDYWSLRLSFDLANSLFLFCVCIIVFSKFTGRSPVFLSVTMAGTGFMVFFLELGSFDCLGNCGLPLWYDIAGFIKYPVFCMSAIIAAKLFKRRLKNDAIRVTPGAS